MPDENEATLAVHCWYRHTGQYNCKRATTCQQGECSKQSPSNTTKDDLRPVCLLTAFMTLALQFLCNMLNETTVEEPEQSLDWPCCYASLTC